MDNSFFKGNLLDITTVRNFIFFARLNHKNIYKPSIKMKCYEIMYKNKPKKDILSTEEQEDVLKYLKCNGIKYNYSTKTQIADFSSCITFNIQPVKTTLNNKHVRILTYFLEKWITMGLQISFFKYFYGLHQHYVNTFENLEGKDHVHYCVCFFSIVLGFFYDKDVNLHNAIENFHLECSIDDIKWIFMKIFVTTDFDLLHEEEIPKDITEDDEYNYKMVKQLGKGSYGLVFKVCKNEKFYAMKVGQLNNEISIVKSISSPYVLKVHNYDKNWFVMDIRKRNLRSYQPQNLKNIIKQLLQGLSDIHKVGVVHMDIKPSNILIDEKENICYIDFGISLKKGNIVHLGSTLWYRAPELLKNGIVEASSSIDIWSLGCIIYELITGNVLFHADDEIQMIQKIGKHKLFENIQYCNLLNDMIRRLDKRLSADELLQKYF